VRVPRWAKGALVGLVTGLTGVTLVLTPLGADFEKNFGLSWLFKIRGPIDPPPDVAVVAINAATARQMQLPPLPRDWPRSIHGRLTEALMQRGASVIVFDLDLQRPRVAEHDLDFAAAVAKAERVVISARLSGMRQPVLDGAGRQVGSVWVEQLQPPIPSMVDAAKGMAPFPLPKVQVDVFDFWAFKPSLADAPTMPAVALQVLALGSYEKWLGVLERAGAQGVDKLPHIDVGDVRATAVNDLMRTFRGMFRDDAELLQRATAAAGGTGGGPLAPRDRQLLRALTGLYAGNDSRYLNFYGPPGTIPTIPYHVLINGPNQAAGERLPDLAGKTVFVGYSDLFDPEQPDRFYTVFTRGDGVDLSGVEIAATAFANLLTDRSVRAADWTASAGIIMAYGAVAGAGTYLLMAIVVVPLLLLLTAGYAVAAQFAFNGADLWLPLATPVLVQMPMALFIGLLGQYMIERRGKLRVSKAMAYYVPEAVARELSEKEIDPSALNKVVHGICLATDMSGFTTLSEKMPPKQLAAFMNEYFDKVAEALKHHQVDVTEFHADTIMCAWVGEESDPRIREKALLAALDVADTVREFSRRQGGLPLYPRVGLDRGYFYLGHTGGGGHFAYSILGDCANTASRLEGLNKHLGCHLLASAPVAEGVRGLLLRPLGRFALMGKGEPVAAIEILGREATANEAALQLPRDFAEALALFQNREWDVASTLFQSILDRHPGDGPSKFYKARCQMHQAGRLSPTDPTLIRLKGK
jgi:adenylate cyclase